VLFFFVFLSDFEFSSTGFIADLKKAAAERGLNIHSGKTKILADAAALGRTTEPSSLQIDGGTFAVLGYEDSTKYLGRKVCCKDPQDVEFDNRVAKAWGAFSKHKQELTDRRHRLKNRLKLFDAVVTSTLLYGCETWSLRTDQRRRLKSVQRKMLRMVLNAKRRVLSTTTDGNSSSTDDSSETDHLEPWPDFLKRTAKWTEEQLEKADIEEWSVQWRRRKWKWALRLANTAHDKWSVAATKWQPLVHSKYLCGRRQARPKRRWEQDFVDFLKSARPEESQDFLKVAQEGKWWLSHADSFAKFSS
jgi:hypothetical protein